MPFDPPETLDDSPPEYVVYSFVDVSVPLVHDWTVGLGTWTFGINEMDLSGTRLKDLGPSTTVYFGPTRFSTTFSAYEIVLVGVLSALVLVPAVFHAVARFCSRSKPAD